MLLVGTVLPRWQTTVTAIFCTVLADLFGPFPFVPITTLPQDILLFIALAGTGLYSREVIVNRQREPGNLRRVEKEVAARREAEEQLEFLIQSSPIVMACCRCSLTLQIQIALGLNKEEGKVEKHS